MTNYLKYNGTGEEDLLKVNSSLVEVDNFLLSTLHTDFQREIDVRISMLTSMLDDPKMQYSGRDYDVFRGGKRAMLEMRNIFIDIQEGLKDLRELQEEEENKDA